MSDDLITSLRALAAARHDDLSIAVDAVIEIERQRAEIERLRKAHQAACEGGDLLRAEIERLTASLKFARTEIGEYAKETKWLRSKIDWIQKNSNETESKYLAYINSLLDKENAKP